MSEERKLLRNVPSGKIEIVWNGTFMRMEMNCDCLDAVSVCRGMCCRWKVGYSVILEADEMENYERIPHPTQKDVWILAPDENRQWCTYFDEVKGLCKIHKSRPKMCRRWHCSTGGQRNDAEIERRDAGWMMMPVRKEEAEFIETQK